MGYQPPPMPRVSPPPARDFAPDSGQNYQSFDLAEFCNKMTRNFMRSNAKSESVVLPPWPQPREWAIAQWARTEAEREVDAWLNGDEYQIKPFRWDWTDTRHTTFANHQAMQEATQ